MKIGVKICAIIDSVKDTLNDLAFCSKIAVANMDKQTDTLSANMFKGKDPKRKSVIK